MKIAWAASIAAQALYAGALWRRSGPSWWSAYLICETIRMAALFFVPMRTDTYWWAWAVTQLAVMVPQISALAVETNASRSRFLGIALGAGAVIWSLTLTDQDWPLARRAGLLLHQCVAYGGLGVLVAAATDGLAKPAMLLYFAVESAEVLAEQIARTPVRVEQLGTVYLTTLSVLFFGIILNERASNYDGKQSH